MENKYINFIVQPINKLSKFIKLYHYPDLPNIKEGKLQGEVGFYPDLHSLKKNDLKNLTRE